MKLMSITKSKITKYGWKAVLSFFMFYLIRDATLYMILPYVLVSR
ncbi:MAG: hypothetical protein WA160_06395 [Pseudobdellovibrio sp.]